MDEEKIRAQFANDFHSMEVPPKSRQLQHYRHFLFGISMKDTGKGRSSVGRTLGNAPGHIFCLKNVPVHAAANSLAGWLTIWKKHNWKIRNRKK